MFSNFIYFLVALILYSTSEFPGAEKQIPENALWIALLFALIFALICHVTFKLLERRTAKVSGITNLENHLEKSLSRLSILAIVLFAADIYILRLNRLLDEVWLFRLLPTLEAMIFLAIFLLYLVLVWHSAWNVQKQYFNGYVSKKSFVISNISFSLPALLPWFILSFTSDLIDLIPFRQPKGFLSTPQGEISYLLIFLVAVACFGPFLIQKIWGCRALEAGSARARIEELCTRANLKYSNILKWELFGGAMITAGVMGIWGRFRYILVTPAMINNLQPEEIDAVILHEIGHIQKMHMHFYLIFFAGYIASVYSLFDPMILIYYSDPLVKFLLFLGINYETGTTFVLSMILIMLFLLYFRYVFGFFMRNFERQADIHVYSYLPDASALIRTFHKIASTSRQSWDKPNWHHYSIMERVNFLNLCEHNPELIEKHNRKVRRMVQGYLIAMVFICSVGYYFNLGHGKEQINSLIAEKILKEQLEGEPHNIEILLLSADYYYKKNKFGQTILYYNMVIALDPYNSYALNNLAWLYATCTDIVFQNYPKALELATRALEVERSALSQQGIGSKPASYILDTYAEACFLNGRYTDALQSAKEALKSATDQKEYYQQRVIRFEKMKKM